MQETIKKTNKQLLNALTQSKAVQMLIPIYQETLRDLAQSGDPSFQRIVSITLKKEQHNDEQSAHFTEGVLREFINTNFPALPNDVVLAQYRDLASSLVKTFLFLNTKDKEKILPEIKNLDLRQVLDLIQLYREGHRKQLKYLQIMAEKDPSFIEDFQKVLDHK